MVVLGLRVSLDRVDQRVQMENQDQEALMDKLYKNIDIYGDRFM